LSCGDLDKTELGDLLNREYNPNRYTAASYQNYLKYYQQAQDAYTSKSTTSYRIEAATVNLLKAIDDLVPIADFSVLLAEIEEEINPMLYTNASYQLYKTVYDSAVIVASNELSKQSVVNNAARNLKMAKQGLVRKTDTSSLAELLKQEFDASEYTSSSYRRYTEAVNSAKALLYDDSASESDVRLAMNGLQQAIAGLTKLSDASQLSALIAELEYQYLTATGKYTAEERYTLATLEVLKNALANAKNAIGNRDTSAIDLLRLTEQLEKAASDMVDKIDLHEAILRMDDHVAMKSKYTSDSFDAYILEITKAMLLTDKYDPSAEEIKVAVEAVENAESKLVRKSIVASGRDDFDLASMEIYCYGIKITVGDYVESYVDFYGQVFASPYMYEQSNVSEFKMKDGYELTISPKLFAVSFENGTRNGELSILGIDFTMDEYTAVEMLGAPTEFSSDGYNAKMAYYDYANGIHCELKFSYGNLSSITVAGAVYPQI